MLALTIGIALGVLACLVLQELRGQILMPTAWPLLRSVGLILLFVTVAVASAFARDPDGRYANSELHAWYESQHNANGQWCCNDADGHAYDGGYMINPDGSVTIGSETIEAGKVLTGPNPTGHAVWWYIENGFGKTTYCFMPGAGT